jgi:hypothetical protein
MGALVAVSIFMRAAAAARFDGFLACTTTPQWGNTTNPTNRNSASCHGGVT